MADAAEGRRRQRRPRGLQARKPRQDGWGQRTGDRRELDYESLTLAQLRARLQSLSVADLEALLAYEEASKSRPVPDPAGQQDHPRDRQGTSAQGSSAENPFPVRAVATRVAAWIDKLGTVWVEGQLTQINLRSSTAYMVLRDPAANMSLDIICPRDLVAAAPVKLTEGTQVIVRGKPSFYTVRGSFSLRVNAIRAVGLGELLA